MQETCKRWGFHLWVRKIPWRRKWQPPPDSCLGIPHTEEPGGPQGHRVRQDWSNLARTTRGSIRVKDGCPEKKIFCCLLNSSNPWIAEMWHFEREKGAMKGTRRQSRRQLVGAPGTLDSPLPICSPWPSFSSLCSVLGPWGGQVPFLQGWEPAAGENHKSPVQCSLALQGKELRDFNNYSNFPESIL